jgi:hypothetical protein
MANANAAHWFSVPLVVHMRLDVGAGPPQNLDQERTGRIQADAVDREIGARKRCRGNSQECRGRQIAGHTKRERAKPLTAAQHQRAAIAPELDAVGRQRTLGVIASRRRLGDARFSISVQGRQQHGGLHLRAGHFGCEGDAAQHRSMNRQRGTVAVAGLDRGSHQSQRRDDPAHRTPGQRCVADQGRWK